MKVLFVSSGNSLNGISSIIRNQGESLKRHGIEIEYFAIKGKGVSGYIYNIFILHKFLKKNTFDIVHAHYSLSAIVASLAGANPLIVSLMGSDVQSGVIFKYMIRVLNKIFWRTCIVKSEEMKTSIGLKKIEVVPNGVNFSIFTPISRQVAINKSGFNPAKLNILFAADPERYEKNFQLAYKAFALLANSNTEFHSLQNIPHDLMPYYYNAADVVLLTSLWEGSPNVIKEAMACCRPIVATDVGDIRDIIGETAGCYISDFTEVDVSSKIKLAIDFQGVTDGRNRINHLNEDVIADRIISIYKKLDIGK